MNKKVPYKKWIERAPTEAFLFHADGAEITVVMLRLVLVCISTTWHDVAAVTVWPNERRHISVFHASVLALITGKRCSIHTHFLTGTQNRRHKHSGLVFLRVESHQSTSFNPFITASSSSLHDYHVPPLTSEICIATGICGGVIPGLVQGGLCIPTSCVAVRSEEWSRSWLRGLAFIFYWGRDAALMQVMYTHRIMEKWEMGLCSGQWHYGRLISPPHWLFWSQVLPVDLISFNVVWIDTHTPISQFQTNQTLPVYDESWIMCIVAWQSQARRSLHYLVNYSNSSLQEVPETEETPTLSHGQRHNLKQRLKISAFCLTPD